MAHPPSRAHTIVYDGDFGIDDAMALLYLAAQPDVELLAIGSVHGNTPSEQAARNAVVILELIGRPSVPVAIGARRPMAQPLAVSAMVHGDDGLGGAAPAPAGAPVAGVSAAGQLVEAIRVRPGEVTVVATGPLTNLGLAVLLDPGIVDLVRQVVVMGGTLHAPGNITPYAEANIANDPEAADLVLRAGFPLTLVGLDVTMSTWMGQPELDRLAAHDSDSARFVWSVLQHYLGFYASRHAQPGCPLHDPSAAVLALHPGLAGYLEAPCGVELRSPHTRGMLLVDRREFAASEHDAGARPIRIATTMRSAEVIDHLVAGLLGEPDR